MDKTLRGRWGWELLKGVIALALAIIIFMNPADALVAIATYIGALAIIAGIVLIIMSLSKRSGFWQFTFGQGVIYALIGLLIVTYPKLTASFLIFLIGLFIVIMGIMQISAYTRLREMMPARPLTLITGIISVLVGGILLFNPFEGAVLATIIIAVYAVLYGITRLYVTWVLLTRKREEEGEEL
ncbi:MAG: HdeD family acid-resistance protein [Bacteroidota bacterium]